MSGFKDYDELVTRTPKRLPLGGQVFEFPQRISARTGVVLLAIRAAALELGTDTDPAAIYAASGQNDD